MNHVNTTKSFNEPLGKYRTWLDKAFSERLEI